LCIKKKDLRIYAPHKHGHDKMMVLLPHADALPRTAPLIAFAGGGMFFSWMLGVAQVGGMLPSMLAHRNLLI